MEQPTMAPRSRPRKRGQTRMDAALDAMRSYGFRYKLIVSTIKELLRVYSDEGWPFIEEASYKVLLERILEKVENGSPEKDNALADHDDGKDDSCGMPHGNLETMANPSSPTNDDESTPQHAPSSSHRSTDQTNNVEAQNCRSFPGCNNAHLYLPPGEGCSAGINQDSGVPVLSRRKPYHGWIDSDEDDDLIYVAPRQSKWDVSPENL